MRDWLRRHDPGRVFIETSSESLTFGQIADAVDERPVSGTEVLRPGLDVGSVIDLLAVMAKGAAVITGDIVGTGEIDPGSIDPAGAVSVVFTSGSTGGRKGVRLTGDNWEAAAEASMEHLGHGPADTWLLALPFITWRVSPSWSGRRIQGVPSAFFPALTLSRLPPTSDEE